MRRFFTLSLLPIFLFSQSASAQINNVKSMEGTWNGQWDNTTYGSHGSVELVITVDETDNSAHGAWNVGGNILATPRDPFTTDITLTSDGFNVDFYSPIWGNISGTGLNSGAFSGVATDCPNTNVSAITSTGTFNSQSITSTFSMTYYTDNVSGTFNVTKENPVNTPTNLSAVETNSVTVSWDDNSDNETGFKLDRKVGVNGVWEELVDLETGASTYLDENVDPETEYYYRIAAYNEDTESDYSEEINITTSPATGIADNSNIPSDYMLLQNYPNPFNPTTNITFILPRESYVQLSVFNMVGEEVAQILNGYRDSGQYRVTFNSAELTSGIYLLKMIAVSVISGNQFVDIKKMVVLK